MEGQKRKALDRLLAATREDPDVLGVLVYGSTARGEQTPDSDIDVCLVLMPERRFSNQGALSAKRLDYLAQSDLDVRIFQQLPLYVRSRVLKEGRVEYVRDEDLLYALALKTVQAFEDFKPLYHEYLEHVANDRS